MDKQGRNIFTVCFSEAFKVKGQYREVSTNTLYLLANDWKHAIDLAQSKNPEGNIRSISKIDYYNGIPLIEE